MRNLCGAIFCMKTNVLQNFQICISVPLKIQTSLNPVSMNIFTIKDDSFPL